MPRFPLPLLLATALLAGFAPTAGATGASGDARYWAVADALQQKLDRTWDEGKGYYRLDAPSNANALLTHAVAALRDHHGPARDDARARRLVNALVSGPPFVATPPPRWHDAQTHAPGFVESMTSRHANQHLVIDSAIVDGLWHAWLARRRLGLSRRAAHAIVDRIHRTAMGTYWRWPTIRLNQINWYALVYAADASVTRNPRLLRRDLRLQLAHFVTGARPSGRAAGNLGPGLHFNYLPDFRRSHPMNLDSAEYANITASFTRVYAQARRAGMAAPPAAARRLLRGWLLRVISGYWTHGGYLNWDTGFGFRRWHQTKKLGLSQQALIGIASAPALAPTQDAPGWAKWMLDRSLALYRRMVDRSPDGTPPGLAFGVDAEPEPGASAWLALTRVQSNAARAVIAGLGQLRAIEPPPLYSFDPDTGRLAVTTPVYNTAVVPTNRGAFPYGGIDLARLYDGSQEVAAGIGGRPPSAFGLLVRDVSGRRVFASQLAGRTRLRLTGGGCSALARTAAWTGRACAGRFADLRVAGVKHGPEWTARTRHRFTAGWTSTSWSLRRTAGRERQTVDVLFPSWGGEDAVISAVMRDGSERRVTSRRLSLDDVARLRVRSRHSGYEVLPLVRPHGATVHLLRTHPQSSAPQPGPTLAVQLVRAARYRSAAFAARLTVGGEGVAG